MSRGFSLAIACLTLGSAAAAHAQVINGSGTAQTTVTAGSTPFNVDAGGGVITFNGNGGSFQSNVTVGDDSITFHSGAATAGTLARTSASSVVDVTLTNDLGVPLSVNSVHSEIIPAGLGFYLQDRSNPPTDANIYQGFPQTLAALGFGDVPTDAAAGAPFASADFNFSIASEGVTLYSVSGTLSLSLDAAGNLVVTNDLGQAQSKLAGFVTAWDTPSALAFAWDTTPVDLDLGWSLAPGESQTLNYVTEISAFTRAGCIDADTCLVAYSGFGDPVGRGGGVQSIASFSAAAADEFITGIVFNPVTVPFSFDVSTGAVPEPATWISLIAGFGLMGAAVRRSRMLARS